MVCHAQEYILLLRKLAHLIIEGLHFVVPVALYLLQFEMLAADVMVRMHCARIALLNLILNLAIMIEHQCPVLFLPKR